MELPFSKTRYFVNSLSMERVQVKSAPTNPDASLHYVIGSDTYYWGGDR
jgi:hypothetical protein